MRISDWSSDVCSSDLAGITPPKEVDGVEQLPLEGTSLLYTLNDSNAPTRHTSQYFEVLGNRAMYKDGWIASTTPGRLPGQFTMKAVDPLDRSEEHTSELQSLMRISYAVFCLKKKSKRNKTIQCIKMIK